MFAKAPGSKRSRGYTPRQAAIYRSPILLVIAIISAIFAAETMVMFLITFLPPFSLPAVAFIDSVLLVAFLFPMLYFLVFRQSRSREIELLESNDRLQTQITERKQAEEALQLERSKLKSILDTMQDGVYVVSQQHEIEYINPVLEKEFGPVNGLKCHEYLHDLPEACTWCDNRDVFSGETVRWEWDSPKTGKTYDNLDTPVRNVDGSISKLGIFRDITDRKRNEEVLRKSEFQLRSLSAELLTTQEEERRRISRELHDSLGQCLSVIYLQLGQIRKNLLQEQKALKEDCEKTLLNLKQVIEEVRRLSRDLSPSILEDLGLTTAMKRLIHDASKHYNLETSLDTDPIEPYLSLKDQINLYRVLQEAVTNIGKHAQATKVTIWVKMQDKRISFFMEDDGKGFDIDQIGKVGPIERGMGLATMKERVRMLGGTLDLKSQAGSGTRITFSIPMLEGGNR